MKKILVLLVVAAVMSALFASSAFAELIYITTQVRKGRNVVKQRDVFRDTKTGRLVYGPWE